MGEIRENEYFAGFYITDIISALEVVTANKCFLKDPKKWNNPQSWQEWWDNNKSKFSRKFINIINNNKMSWLVRAEAADALGSMKDINSVDHLISALKHEKNEYTLESIAGALTKILHKKFMFGRKRHEKWENWWNKNKGKLLT